MPARERAVADEEPAPRRARRKPESADSGTRTRRPPPEETRSRTKERAPIGRQNQTAPMTARQVAATAASAVSELTGHPPESITSIERDDEGWRVGVEVLESRRIPDSTDILAIYQVVLENDGQLVSYHRERRYHRGRPEKEPSS